MGNTEFNKVIKSSLLWGFLEPLKCSHTTDHTHPPGTHLFTEYLTGLVSHGTHFEKHHSGRLTPKQHVSATRDRGVLCTGKIFNNLLSKDRKQKPGCLPISMVWILPSWLISSYQGDINEHRAGQRAYSWCQDTTQVWGAKANSQPGEWWARRKQPVLTHSLHPVRLFLWRTAHC